MRKPHRLIFVLGAVALLAIAVLQLEASDDDRSGLEVAAPPLNEDDPGWQDLGSVPVSPRRDYAVAVTDGHVVVVGGRELEPIRLLTPLNDGAILDLATGRWTPTDLPFDVPVAQLRAASDSATVVVLGSACRESDAEDGLQSCVPGTLRAARLHLVTMKWEELEPPKSENVEAIQAIGGQDGLAAFQVGSRIELLQAEAGWRRSQPPLSLAHGRACLGAERLTVVDAPGSLDMQEAGPSGQPAQGAPIAWSADVSTARHVGEGRTSRLDRSAASQSAPLDYAVVCTSRGAVIAASDGGSAAAYDSLNGQWTDADDVPVALGPTPLAVPFGAGSVVVATTGIDSQYHVTFDASTTSWHTIDVPDFLLSTRPEALAAGDSTVAVAVRTPDGEIALAIRRSSP